MLYSSSNISIASETSVPETLGENFLDLAINLLAI
jgi:hypothetical protein